MSDNVLQDLMLENFRAIRQELGTVRADISDIKASLAGIRQHMSGFMASDAAH